MLDYIINAEKEVIELTVIYKDLTRQVSILKNKNIETVDLEKQLRKIKDIIDFNILKSLYAMKDSFDYELKLSGKCEIDYLYFKGVKGITNKIRLSRPSNLDRAELYSLLDNNMLYLLFENRDTLDLLDNSYGRYILSLFKRLDKYNIMEVL